MPDIAAAQPPGYLDRSCVDVGTVPAPCHTDPYSSHPLSPTEIVRRKVRQALTQLGVPPDAELTEAVLIQGGIYCGRRFESAGYRAVWFADENEIKVLGPNGAVIDKHNVDQPNVDARHVGHRMAA
jgi:hypothetical protein